MHSLRGILSTTLFLALLAPVLANTPDQQTKSQEAEQDAESFQKLLDQVDSPSLHAALHDYSPKKFQHGMFQEDRNAVKAIHSSEPKAAHKIIELAKRQDGGVSNSSISASQSRASPVPPISQGSSLGSSFLAPSTTSSAVISSAPSTGFSSSAALTSFSVSNTSSATPSSTQSGSSKTVASVSSASATRSSITSTAVHVTTLPNGSQSTVTAITVVPAGGGAGGTPTGEAGAGSGTGNSPSLQTGEAVMSRSFGREGMAVLVGALGFAAMM